MTNASSLPPHRHHHHHPNNPLSCLGLEFWLLLVRGFLLGMPDQQLLTHPTTSSTSSASTAAPASPASKRRRGGGGGGPPTASSSPLPCVGSSGSTSEGERAVACLRATCRWWRVAASVATAVAPEALLLGAQERRARWAAGGATPAAAAAAPRARLRA
eukprot:Rhum_TRINITY_DN1646_c0_g1::Rhum_TRINITY_DN1646_c0_g1_i1::g.4673::m.4673